VSKALAQFRKATNRHKEHKPPIRVCALCVSKSKFANDKKLEIRNNDEGHMTNQSVRFLLPVVLLYAFAATGQSPQSAPQDVDRVTLNEFLVEGGRSNRIEGGVERISGNNSVTALKSNRVLANGDTIQSASSGRAEILLIPGYYLRLDHNTRISLLDLSPDNLKLKLWSGSAILEVASVEMVVWSDFVEQRKQLSCEPVSLLTPTAEYIVASGGSYRFDVDAKEDSELRVLKGVAFVNGSRIDSGRIASGDRGKVVLRSTAKPQDEFDSWSRQRAKSLVKANGSLNNSQWYKRVRSNRGYVLIKDPEDASRARERLTVSAEPGVVVLAENASVSRAGAPAWWKLQTDERLTNGDRVRTAVESRAEIHLYPNYFLFLEGDTEIVCREFEGQVAVEMIKGSAVAILEPDTEATEPAVLTIVADKTEHRLSEKGNYRISMIAGAKPELLVYDGTTRVPLSEVSRSKKNRPSDKAHTEIFLHKLTGDGFDIWSYRRSRLVEIRSFRRYFGPFGGMWCLVESTGEYTFVPARWQYSSPYGGRYSIRFAEDTSFERPRPNPAQDPLEPPFRPIRP
jgi:ferric-dicitrate binding protein FerR (iron transport regulator)